MTQKTDPFVHLAWGWASGEDGWGTGLNNNLITYAFFHNKRFDGSVANTGALPASPTNGQAYFVTADNTFYFRAEGVWYSTIPPVGMTFILKSNEAIYKFTGGSLVLDTKAISDITGLQTALDNKVDDSQVGAANGVAPLGADSKIPSGYLPEGGSYQGTWNATTNTPTIISGVGSNGDFYKVSVGGTTTIDGVSSWSIGDEIRFNGTVWQRIPNSAGVTSVNGATGAVVLTAADIGATPSSHVSSGGTQHANATTSVAGFQSAADKTKLDGVASGATANQTDAYLLARANHTGTQAQSTIVNLVTDLSAKQATLVNTVNLKSINGISLLGAGDVTISGGGGGSTTFTGLTDTPSTYVGNAGKVTRVNVGETALEFVALGTAAFNNSGDFATASHTHANATTSLAGFMSAADKITLNGAAPTASPTFTGTVVLPSTTSIGTVTNTEISYLSGVTSSIQTQLSNKQPSDADLTAIAALAGTSGLLRKTAANTWSLDTAPYITGNQPVTLSGDVTGSGTTAITTTLASSGVSAGTYKSVTVDVKGRVTAGTNPTTFAGFGIVDTLNSLSDVTITSIASGEILKWNGTAWVNNTLAEAGIQPAGSYLTGNQTITLSGDATGSGTTAITITFANSGVAAASYGTSIQVPTITFDAKGRATTASNTTIRSGTTAQTGVVQLTDSIASTSTTTAATPNSVKTAYDLANGKMSANPLVIEVGRQDGVASTTYIDFHSSATVADYNARIDVTGGTGTSASGAMTFSAASYTFNTGAISGSGSGLTNLNASSLSSGTVASARLPFTYSPAAGANTVAQRDALGGLVASSAGFTSETFVNNTRNPIWRFGNSDAYGLSFFTGTAAYAGTDSIGFHFGTATSAGSSVNIWGGGLATTGTVTAASFTGSGSGITGVVQKAAPSQTFQNLGNVSGARTISAASGIHVIATATGNITWTFPSPASTEAHALTLELVNGGAYTMIWPSGTAWTGGVAPTLTASGTDVLVFTKVGTFGWRGYLSSKDSK